jgi:hypothetical protein
MSNEKGAQYIAPLRRSILVLSLFFTILLMVAWLGGRAMGRIDDPRALHFALCDGRPCALDMLPGTTSWADAAQLLSRYPIDGFDDKHVYTSLSGVSIESYISIDAMSVGRIYLSFPREMPLSAGWVIQRFGVPCGVSLYGSGDLMTLRYPLLLANVRVVDGAFSMDAPVTTIHLSDPHFDFERQPDPCIDNITTRQMLNTHWQGFTPLSVYWRRG